MKPFENPIEMYRAFHSFVREHWTSLPEEIKEVITKNDEPGVNPNDQVANVVEAMYANRKKSGVNNKGARELIGRAAAFMGGHGLLYFRDGRGYAMMQAMARENREPLEKGASPYPKAEEDPEIAPYLQEAETETELEIGPYDEEVVAPE